jgi:hypothetical protein
MPFVPDKPARAESTARRGRRAFGLAVLGLAALASVILLIILAMALLPPLLVDESAYRLPDGTRDAPAVQSAYNAVRVPIGVTCAALLAGLAAAAGVLMNARTVAVARETLAQSRARDDDARAQWRETLAQSGARDEDARAQWRAEHLQSRFTDAAKQLGDPAAAIRLAGVLSMAALADDWSERRQSCVDVLCSYARQPLDESDGVERNIRRIIVEQVFMRLEASAPVSWSDLRIDLSGAFIEGVGFFPWPITVRELAMNGAIIDGFFALDDLTVREELSLDRIDVRYRFRVLLSLAEHTRVSANDLVVPNGVRFHIGVWRSEEVARQRRGGFVGVSNLLAMSGGEVTVSLRGFFNERSLAIGRAQIAPGSRVSVVMAEGTADPGSVFVTTLPGEGLVLPRISESLRSAVSRESTFDVMSGAETKAMFDPAPRGMPGQPRARRTKPGSDATDV